MTINTFLFFCYRDWAIDIFNRVDKSNGNFILLTNKVSCDNKLISKLKPDVLFFYGWSWKIPEDIVEDYTCLCLHPSPLPKYRGGSPIQNQIISGESSSAVSIFKMNGNLDEGPIYFQEPMSLDGDLYDVFNRVIDLGVVGTNKFLSEFINKTPIKYSEQDNNKATLFKRRSSTQSEINPSDFNVKDAKYFYDMVRSLKPPYPECFIKCGNGKLILKEVSYE